MNITECPRDAMQGIKTMIPTSEKVAYLNALLRVGFDYLDFGSFVSPKAIPQMADTAQVLEQIDWANSHTQLLAIVANERGASEAVHLPGIAVLGYPLSVSETFQMRNVNKTIAQSMQDIMRVKEHCHQHGKRLQVYLSMGFGNPYGDPYSPEVVTELAYDLYHRLGITDIAPSDTVGSSEPLGITSLFQTLTTELPQVRFSAHLHTLPHQAISKLEAAWQGGCRHFDAAMMGFGGCPMAADELTGNMPTEVLAAWLKSKGEVLPWDDLAWADAVQAAGVIFGPFAGQH